MAMDLRLHCTYAGEWPLSLGFYHLQILLLGGLILQNGHSAFLEGKLWSSQVVLRIQYFSHSQAPRDFPFFFYYSFTAPGHLHLFPRENVNHLVELLEIKIIL